MQVPPPSDPRRGFSRIDALASLVAVALLAFVALPLRAGGAKAAQTALCADQFQRIARALALYSLDHGWYPPNYSDGATLPGRNWVPGNAGPGGPQEFNPDILDDPSRSLLVPYLEGPRPGRVFACPADERAGLYQGTSTALRGTYLPAARSVAMNVAVGVNPVASGHRPTDGAWLDNNFGHTYGRRWRTYGRPEHAIAPSPAALFLVAEEDAQSLNDGTLAHGMERAEWIDWPATRHDLGAHLSFADGHVEYHRWIDARTVVGTSVARLAVPGSPDYRWLSDRTSALIEP